MDHPEDGDSVLFWNADTDIADYIASHAKRWTSLSAVVWEPQISQTITNFIFKIYHS